MPDPFNLARFRLAQDETVDGRRTVYDRAIVELKAGRKETHWSWFIFPQPPLGTSPMSRRYAIRSWAEADAYLADAALRFRLTVAFDAAAPHGRDLPAVLGAVDTAKAWSSASLFVRLPAARRLLSVLKGGRVDLAALETLR